MTTTPSEGDRSLTIHIAYDPRVNFGEGGWLGTVNELGGVTAIGDTPAEAAANIAEAIEGVDVIPPLAVGEQDRTAELHATTDAAVWARVFEEVMAFHSPDGVPAEDVMLGWFANAIETGRQAGARDARAESPPANQFELLADGCDRHGRQPPGFVLDKILAALASPEPPEKEGRTAGELIDRVATVLIDHGYGHTEYDPVRFIPDPTTR